MRTKKIGDQSPLRVPVVPAKKIATLPFTFSVVEYDTARDALLNAIRGFSVDPVCHIRRSAMELADIL